MPSPTSRPLSVAQMHAAIDAGRGIIYNGAVITDKKALPGAIEITTDPAERQRLRLDMIAERARIAAQIRDIETGGAASANPPAAHQTFGTNWPADPARVPAPAPPPAAGHQAPPPADRQPPAQQAGEFAVAAAADTGPTDLAETGEGRKKE